MIERYLNVPSSRNSFATAFTYDCHGIGGLPSSVAMRSTCPPSVGHSRSRLVAKRGGAELGQEGVKRINLLSCRSANRGEEQVMLRKAAGKAER